jgi:hypothetical protein
MSRAKSSQAISLSHAQLRLCLTKLASVAMLAGFRSSYSAPSSRRHASDQNSISWNADHRLAHRFVSSISPSGARVSVCSSSRTCSTCGSRLRSVGSGRLEVALDLGDDRRAGIDGKRLDRAGELVVGRPAGTAVALDEAADGAATADGRDVASWWLGTDDVDAGPVPRACVADAGGRLEARVGADGDDDQGDLVERHALDATDLGVDACRVEPGRAVGPHRESEGGEHLGLVGGDGHAMLPPRRASAVERRRGAPLA